MGDNFVAFKADNFVVRINRPGQQPGGAKAKDTSKQAGGAKTKDTEKQSSGAKTQDTSKQAGGAKVNDKDTSKQAGGSKTKDKAKACTTKPASASLKVTMTLDAATMRDRLLAEAEEIKAASAAAGLPGRGIHPSNVPLPTLPIEAYYMYPRSRGVVRAEPVRPAAQGGGAEAGTGAGGDAHFLVWLLLGLVGLVGVVGGVYTLIQTFLPTEEAVNHFLSDVLPSLAVLLGILALVGAIGGTAGYYVYFYFPFLPFRINRGALALPTITLPTIRFLPPPKRGTFATTGVAFPVFSTSAPTPAQKPKKAQVNFKIN